MKRNHQGVAASEGNPQARPDHKPEPSSPDPRRAVCLVCGQNVHYVKRTYGPNGKAAYWQHTGDGLAQYRSWGTNR